MMRVSDLDKSLYARMCWATATTAVRGYFQKERRAMRGYWQPQNEELCDAEDWAVGDRRV